MRALSCRRWGEEDIGCARPKQHMGVASSLNFFRAKSANLAKISYLLSGEESAQCSIAKVGKGKRACLAGFPEILRHVL